MKWLAVLGSPITHSLSPAIHRAAYRTLGLDWQYEAVEVAAGNLRDFLSDRDSNWQGLSLTMPLKAEAIEVCDEASPLAQRVGGANTITWHGPTSRAQNTDVLGFLNAIRLHGVANTDAVAILGGGATARAAVAAVSEFAESITVYIRDPLREEGLIAALGESAADLRILAWDQASRALAAPLVISTTPQGVGDFLVDSIPPHPGVLFDVLYSPWPTPIAAEWHWRGGQVLGGLDLLVEQAIEQIRLFIGEQTDLDDGALRTVMLAAGYGELKARKGGS